MTLRSFPWSNVPVYTQDWSLMVRRFRSSGVFKDVGNQLEVFADSTGLIVKVNDGDAFIMGHYISLDAVTPLVIPTPDTINDRIDSIIIRVNWNTETVLLVVLQGTPAAVPSAPALTQNNDVWEFELANVYVAANAVTIEPVDVTDKRAFSPDGGGDVTVELLNNYGSSVNDGDVIVFDPSADKAFTVTDVASDLRVMGIARQVIASGSVGTVGVTPGSVVEINCTEDEVNRGEFLVTSSTAGKAKSAGYIKSAAAFAISLTAKATGSAGKVWAMLTPPFAFTKLGDAGWACGGALTTDNSKTVNSQKLIVSVGVWNTIPGAELINNNRVGAVGGSLFNQAGYVAGGNNAYSGGTATTPVDKIAYADDTVSAATALSVVQGYINSGAGAETKFYLIGTFSSSTLNRKGKYVFSTEIHTVTSDLPSAIDRIGNGSDGVYVYSLGGYNGSYDVGSGWLTVAATDETSNQPQAATPTASRGYLGCSFPGSYAFFSGAAGRKIDFATGNNSATASNATGVDQGMSVSDGVGTGYMAGNSYAYSFNKSTETYTGTPNQLTPNKYFAAFFNNGAY